MLTLSRTGTKCLPESALPKCQGTVLHDCHAEVIAYRGFNRWVLNELENILSDPHYQSKYIQASSISSQHVFKASVTLHFFTTEAPCGDASMELLIQSKSPEEARPWTDVPHTSDKNAPRPLLGRGYFSQLGAVRRKPSRGDAEATMSKSCTDKLAMKQFTSLLSFPADTFIAQTANCFVSWFVVYEDRYIHAAHERSFGKKGRLQTMENEARRFNVCILPSSCPRFEFEKESTEIPSKASNVSALWIRGSGHASDDTIEVLLNGVKQGFKQFENREGKQSAICRKQMWSSGVRVAALLASTHQRLSTGPGPGQEPVHSYRDAKGDVTRLAKRHLKARVAQILTGWARNTGDEEWSLT